MSTSQAFLASIFALVCLAWSPEAAAAPPAPQDDTTSYDKVGGGYVSVDPLGYGTFLSSTSTTGWFGRLEAGAYKRKPWGFFSVGAGLESSVNTMELQQGYDEFGAPAYQDFTYVHTALGVPMRFGAGKKKLMAYGLVNPRVLITSAEGDKGIGIGLQTGFGLQGLINQRFAVGGELTHSLDYANGQLMLPLAFRFTFTVHFGKK